MTVYEANRGIDAEPDLVLNTAGDPARTGAWLTDALGARDVRTETEPPRLRFTWPGGRGELHVEARGAGASTARLRLDGGDQAAADRALDALAAVVDDNFTAG
ncbi:MULTISPECIES: hypothetical protein [Amycolatopsis]|uniref:Phosphomannomutase n=2 Tax=Amycolatopsis TaxID=1813 RepID=A0A1I3PYD6_9PSEU|nr:hypothetical protein [Amycolatopsis sacchari]SFJ26884.1 hypothetical protein SAMN05421835_104110 [Amycolatopsis sacchari]